MGMRPCARLKKKPPPERGFFKTKLGVKASTSTSTTTSTTAGIRLSLAEIVRYTRE